MYLHEGEFRSELFQLENMSQIGLNLSIDPAWLAQLASVLWYVYPCATPQAYGDRVSCHYLVDEPSTIAIRMELGLTQPELTDLTCQLYEALDLSFMCAEWIHKPQVRILQAISVACPSGRDHRDGRY